MKNRELETGNGELGNDGPGSGAFVRRLRISCFRLSVPYSLLFALLILLTIAPGSTGCGGCDTEIATNAVPDATVGVAYDFRLQSHCGGDTWFLENGNLPPGIGLLEVGTLRGTPTTPGTFTFTIGVIDDDSRETASKGFSLKVTPAQ